MILLLWEILPGKGGGDVERFGCSTLVVSGAGALEVLKEQKCCRMLVVTPPRLLGRDRIPQVVRAAGDPRTEVFEDGFPPASMTRAVEGSRKITAFQPELVVVLGDGPTLDLGKAMVCFSRQPCTLAVIPTTLCAGEEVTDQVTLLHNGGWHLLRDRNMRPDIAILDNALTERRSGGQMAEDGFSLLAAALEAYTAVEGGALRDIHAREAFAAGWGALPAACAGNTGACRRLMTASVLAGMALDQAEPGLCSAMAGSLQQVFGLSRGRAAGILMPAILGCNGHAAGRRYAELSRAAGLGGSREDIGIRNLRTGLIRLRRELGLPGTLVQAGVDIRSVWAGSKRVVELTLADERCRCNPVAVDDFLVRRILEEITGRL